MNNGRGPRAPQRVEQTICTATGSQQIRLARKLH